MFILGNLIITIANLADILLMILWWLILIRALISWVSPDPFNVIVRFLHQATEPILDPIRRLLPPMAVDVSPIIAFLGIMVVRSFLLRSLYELGERLKM
jgi:YggT family protein